MSKSLIGSAAMAFAAIYLSSCDDRAVPDEHVIELEKASTGGTSPAAENPLARRFANKTPAEIEAKVKELVEMERTLPREDVEARLSFWDDIQTLDPSNKEYAAKRDELRREIAAHQSFRDNPEMGADIIEVRPSRGGFGTVLVTDLTIRNRSLSDLKDFQLVCDNIGPSRSVIGQSKAVLYEVVPARSTKTFKEVNMGFMHPQTKSADCHVRIAAIG
jgi:hypothetical protein